MKNEVLTSSHNIISSWFYETYNSVLGKIPQIISAIIIFLIGIAVAYFIKFLLKKIIDSLDVIFNKAASGSIAVKVKKSYAYVISNLFFWCTLIFFLDVSVNVLGWQLIRGWLDSFVGYLPNILAALILILAGSLLSIFIKEATKKLFIGFAKEKSIIFPAILQWSIVIITVLLAVQQIGINVSAIVQIFIILCSLVLGGFILSVVAGVKTLSSNLISSHYNKRIYNLGDKIYFEEFSGTLVDITPTSLILQNEDKKIIIPSCLLQKSISHIKIHKADKND